MEIKPDVLVFPDASAYERYKEMVNELPIIVMDKVRDPLTGWITSLEFNTEKSDMEWISQQQVQSNVPACLIIDDLSDYGGTFKRVAASLKENFNCGIGLYVTHFLNHGDINSYLESGISKIYTTDSLSVYRNFRNNGGYDCEGVF